MPPACSCITPCLHYCSVCITSRVCITPVSVSPPVSASPQCLYHLSCLHHPSVCITSHVCVTPVSVSPPVSASPQCLYHLSCLRHPCVCVTPVSASPLCLHHLSCLHRPRVCLHPTWPPHPGISVSPHPRLRVPGTGFRSHPQNGGPHLYLISSAKTVSPEVSLSEVPGGCDLGDYCHYRGYK